MELLRVLTLIYAAVLVLALAASLLAVWIYLRRVSRALGNVREALEAARRETGPLEDWLRPLRDLFEETAAEMKAAECAMERVEEVVAERAGAGTLAR